MIGQYDSTNALSFFGLCIGIITSTFHFSGTLPVPQLALIKSNNSSFCSVYNTDINIEELERALKIKKNTTPGIDNIPYKLISVLKTKQKEELLDLINASWGTGKVPEKWKVGVIIPRYTQTKEG